MSSVHLEVPPRSAYVAVVRLALTALGRGAGVPEDKLDDLKMAVGEACANAVLANEGADGHEAVSVSWLEEDGRVVVEVTDRSAAVEAGNLEDSQGISTRLAMSMALLRSLVDACDFIPGEDGGTRTRLVVEL